MVRRTSMSEIITKVEVSIDEEIKRAAVTQIHNLVSQYVIDSGLTIKVGNTIFDAIGSEVNLNVNVTIPIVKSNSLKTKEIEVIQV